MRQGEWGSEGVSELGSHLARHASLRLSLHSDNSSFIQSLPCTIIIIIIMKNKHLCFSHTNFLSSPSICTPILLLKHPPSLHSTCSRSMSDLILTSSALISPFSPFSILISLFSSPFFTHSLLSSLFYLIFLFSSVIFFSLFYSFSFSTIVFPCNTARVRLGNHQQPRGQNTHWSEEQSIQVVRTSLTLPCSPLLYLSPLALSCSLINFYPKNVKQCFWDSVYVYRQHSVKPLNHPLFCSVVALFIPLPLIYMLQHLFTFMIMHYPLLTPLLIILLSLLFLVIWLVCVCVCVCVQVGRGWRRNEERSAAPRQAEYSGDVIVIFYRTFLTSIHPLKNIPLH